MKDNNIVGKHKDTIIENGYCNVILDVTREALKKGELVSSIIDHIITNIFTRDIESRIIRTKIADHYPISIRYFNRFDINSVKGNFIKVRNNKAIKLELQKIDWNNIQIYNVEENYNVVMHTYNGIVEKNTYVTTKRKQNKSWISDNTFIKMKERDSIWEKNSKRKSKGNQVQNY